MTRALSTLLAAALLTGCATIEAPRICKADTHKRGAAVVITFGGGRPPSAHVGIAGRTHDTLHLGGPTRPCSGAR